MFQGPNKKSTQLLLEEGGIDFGNNTFSKDILAKKHTVVILDDAQAKYDDLTFWALLIKSSNIWLPLKIKFIIASTFLLSGTSISSFALQYLPRIERSAFLLTPDESNEFLELPVIGLPQKMKSETLKQVIIRECGGLIGALRLSVDSLKDRFSEDTQPSETALLQHFLSNDLFTNKSRCFGKTHSASIENDFKMFLKKIMVDEKQILKSLVNEQDNS